MDKLSEILIHSSRQFPDRIALEEPNEVSLNYSELYQASYQVAQLLTNHNIGKGARVGVFVSKSIESVTAILGILAIEAAYIPVDVLAPSTRAAYIFEDCQVSAVLVSSADVDNLIEALDCSTELYSLANNTTIQLLLCHHLDKKVLGVPIGLAYMLYTSGSTGQPKGVMITHENAICFIEWCAHQFDIQKEHCFLSLAPFHFDLSIFDLYVSLLKGARLVLANQKIAKNPMMIAQLVDEKKINIIYSTPSLLKLIEKYGKCERYDHTSLKLVLFAGEVYAIPALKKLKACWPNIDLYNLYGPTETNVVTYHKIPQQVDENQVNPFPIGKSCPYVACKLWKDGGVTEAKEGLRGELIVSGQSVAYGYLGLDKKSEESFFTQDAIRWYKTGDIVEVDSDLNFIFSGRTDRMIKRNGYRIELAEIEAALHQHESIVTAAVISFLSTKNETRIKVFIQYSEGREKLSSLELRQFCLTYLPLYMLPDQFVAIDQLPQTSTHKIDYQQLKQLSL